MGKSGSITMAMAKAKEETAIRHEMEKGQPLSVMVNMPTI
jgi:hypothetical protein